ncbi:MAG: hypothetical protein H6922_06415 [Pseudomonadaceae bacterium]|nr:hypothetical protein [Pseudomonadaceae bacterium]
MSAAVMMMTGVAHAVDQDVEVDAEFRQALSLTLNNDIDFTPGATYIEYTTGSIDAADFITLGTNDTVAYVDDAFSGPTTGQAGDVSINGATGADVNISCTTGATISDGTNTLSVDQMQVSMNTGDAFGAADYTCAGLGTTPHSYTLTGTDNILMGGRIVGNSGTITDSVYSTTNASGVAATVRVVYQ